MKNTVDRSIAGAMEMVAQLPVRERKVSDSESTQDPWILISKEINSLVERAGCCNVEITCYSSTLDLAVSHCPLLQYI